MITGSIVALVTPMHADGGVDWNCLERLIDWHLESGTAAIGAVGTTGESSTLNPKEHWRSRQILRAVHCRPHSGGRRDGFQLHRGGY